MRKKQVEMCIPLRVSILANKVDTWDWAMRSTDGIIWREKSYSREDWILSKFALIFEIFEVFPTNFNSEVVQMVNFFIIFFVVICCAQEILRKFVSSNSCVQSADPTSEDCGTVFCFCNVNSIINKDVLIKLILINKILIILFFSIFRELKFHLVWIHWR